MGRLHGCLIALLLLALAYSHAVAFPLPSLEEVEQLKADGVWDQRLAQLESLRESTSTVLSEQELLELVERDFGLTTKRGEPEQQSGSLRANLDANDVVDERDVLELGYANLSRSASTTQSYGNVAAGTAPKCLVLLIKFPDQNPTDMKNQGSASDVNHDAAWAADKWFDLSTPADLEDSSVGYYFKTASYGKLEIEGDVFNNPAVCDAEGWITSSETYAEMDSNALGYTSVLEDAVAQVDPHIDFADYDSNGDGYIDGLITIYAGPDNGGTSGCLWYFRWLSDPFLATADGIRLSGGLWLSEEGYLYHFCHEFGHELGLPDLYDVGAEFSGPAMPGAGIWTLMADWTAPTGRIPVLPDAWCRERLRWVTPVDVATTSGDNITINHASGNTPLNTVFRVWRNGARERQCFLCEFRDADHGFDVNLSGNGGILIWHVDEARVTANNHDNAFNPQRVWLETANNGQPNSSLNPWREGHNGADAVDYFDDTTTPSAKDNAGANTSVVIDPTSDATGTTMTATVSNEAAGLPSLSWDSPADGATVTGTVTMDVTSDASQRVEYYVDGCLKYIEVAPSPYDGFSWDTETALDGTAELRAIAVGAGTARRVIERTVTVDNSGDGKSLPFSDNFNSYASDQDPNLLALWNLHEHDVFGLDLRVQTVPGMASQSLAFAQSSFPQPPLDGNNSDPNTGVYEGQDNEWLMSPRLDLAGFTNLELKFKTSFRASFPGDLHLQVQISDDDGASWTDIAGLARRNQNGSPYDTGEWDLTGSFTRVVQKTYDLDAWVNEEIYVRLLYVGGGGYGTGFAIDDFEVTGTALSLFEADPDRAVVGQQITLSGNGLGASQGSGEVRFNDGAGGFVSQASVVSWSDTEIVCAVPAGAKSHPSEGVWVRLDGGQDTDKLPFRVILPPPVIGGLDQR